VPPLRHTGPGSEAERPDYAGRYPLESYLGSGGMGVVHLATSASGLRLAVKVIHANQASDPEFRARFRQEIAAARRVSGAFTAPVVDADPEAERPWMATLFIDGPTLSERVKRTGPLDAGELVMLGAGLAEGLRDIHRAGVVHRDLKPSNVLLADDGPKVIDFGISRPTDSDLRTETGKLIGTPPFMAPEQFERPREVGPAADVFAMGAVLVHAATGRGPFDSDSPYVVAYQVVHKEPDLVGVPENLLPLIRQCLAKDPANRPTPDELMAALRPSAYGTVTFTPAPAGSSRSASAASTATAQPRTVQSRTAVGRRIRWVTAGVVVAALAGYVGVSTAGRDSSLGHPAEVSHAGKQFRPWDTKLGAGAGRARAPVCSAGGAAIYCTAPGIEAARLDPVDGHIVWLVKNAGATGADTSAPPILSGGLVHVVQPGGSRLEALDPATGKKRWDIDVPGYINAILHVAGSAVLVTSDGLLRSVDSETGKEHWTQHLAGEGASLAAASGGAVFAVTATDNATNSAVTAVDPSSGAVLWVKRLTGPLTALGASDDALFLLSRDSDDAADAVVRLDSARRAVRRFPLAAPVEQAQATPVGDKVYVMGYAGSLLSIDTSGRGTARNWRLETSVTWASLPVARGNCVYLSAGDGRLLAVDSERGVLLGQTKPRMGEGAHTLVAALPAPFTAGGKVFATAPDGSVFAVDGRDPAGW
jgi:outer membrane protein assembly factor BamB